MITTKKAEQSLFKKILMQAEEINTLYIMQLDNLENNDVASVLYEALRVLDFTEEQPEEYLSEKYNGCGSMTPTQLKNYREKVKKFIRKYRDYCEEEGEKRMYINI